MSFCIRPRRGFTMIEVMTTIALLIILLGLMVSLARHVRSTSATQLTNDILRRLDESMAMYVRNNNDTPPAVPAFIAGDHAIPPDSALQTSAERNNGAFVSTLKSDGLLRGRFDDLSIAYYDEAHVRDAWGSPIVFMPTMHPAVGMNVKGWFFFSAGPDRRYLTRDDNLYSYDLTTGAVK